MRSLLLTVCLYQDLSPLRRENCLIPFLYSVRMAYTFAADPTLSDSALKVLQLLLPDPSDVSEPGAAKEPHDATTTTAPAQDSEELKKKVAMIRMIQDLTLNTMTTFPKRCVHYFFSSFESGHLPCLNFTHFSL